MSYSASNTQLWNVMISFGALATILLVSNFLLRKIGFLRKLLVPTAVLAGFITLGLRSLGWLDFISTDFLNTVTYHGIAIGFIAMSLRVPNKSEEFARTGTGLRSGAMIAGSYVIQALAGIAVSAFMMKDIFPAAGILLPMGFGQGPGQANNVGSTYEALGFEGGQSFGLSIAAAGYLCACTVGLIIVSILRAKGRIPKAKSDFVSGNVPVDTFQDQREIPISQSIDRFSIQAALVLAVYLLTYLVSWGITSAIESFAPGLANTVNSLIWGFNFIIGSALAILVRVIFSGAKKTGFMTRQYQNNYLLSRISGAAFDFMIICGIAAIDISKLNGMWVPFIVMCVAGTIMTAIHLAICSKRVYKGYSTAGFLSMFGMMTGTISSGVVLLREADPEFTTPAANNLVTGSSFAIMLGAPMLLLVGIAPNNMRLTAVILVAYYVTVMCIILFRGKKAKAFDEAFAAKREDSAKIQDAPETDAE